MAAAQRRSDIVAVLRRHGLRPRKRLGQHFLADPNIVDRIVRFAGIGAGDRVIEIGAGTGTLTLALAEAGAHVVAYEVDEALAPLLAEVLEGRDVDLRIADVLEDDLPGRLDGTGWKLVANLPYNIGTPLLLDLLRDASAIDEYTVMVQREVADRLAAEPGTRVYGLPSVVARLYGEVRFGFAVSPQVFLPPPDVGSAVLSIRRIEPDPLAEVAERIAGVAFGMRRKMLRRSLAASMDDPTALLEACGLDPTARPEELSADDYLTLARSLETA